MNNKHVV